MRKIKAASVLRALLAAGVPADRAREIAESAAKLRCDPDQPWWERGTVDPRALARIAPYTCQPVVREEREAA